MTGNLEISRPDDVDVGVDSRDAHQRAGGAGRGLAILLTVGGAVGFVAAFVLAVERIELLKDPSYVPSCSFNPVLSCGSVMQTWQIAAFAAVTTIGVVLLVGATLPRWFWLGLQAGVVFGVGFVHWLIYQSLYEIGALCPYCMVIWVVTIPIFWYVTVHNIQAGHIAASPPVRRVLVRNRGFVLTLWFLVIAALVLVRFWDYWSTLV